MTLEPKKDREKRYNESSEERDGVGLFVLCLVLFKDSERQRRRKWSCGDPGLRNK